MLMREVMLMCKTAMMLAMLKHIVKPDAADARKHRDRRASESVHQPARMRGPVMRPPTSAWGRGLAPTRQGAGVHMPVLSCKGFRRLNDHVLEAAVASTSAALKTHCYC